jgi:hypothetical protein
VSFFEPLPPPPPESVRQWSPPAWDRPSEGTLPAIVPVGEIVHRSDDVVVELEHVRVYPNGFTINLFILTNPHVGQGRAGYGMLGGAGLDQALRFPRIGVRFADGRTAGREASFRGDLDVAKDDRGIPTEPILTMTGGGGGSHGYHFGVWVFPLPPDGPLEVYVSLPAADDPESKVVLDGAVVRSVAERARVIWR